MHVRGELALNRDATGFRYRCGSLGNLIALGVHQLPGNLCFGYWDDDARFRSCGADTVDALDAHNLTRAVEPTIGVRKPEGGIGVATFDKAIAIPAVHRTREECRLAGRADLNPLTDGLVERHGSDAITIGNTLLSTWNNRDCGSLNGFAGQEIRHPDVHFLLVTMRTYTKFRSLHPARTGHLFCARSIVKGRAPADDDIPATILVQCGCKRNTCLGPAVHFATNGDVLAANQRPGRVTIAIGSTALHPGNPSIPVIRCDRIELSAERPNIVGIEGNACRRGWVGDNQWITRTDDIRVARNKLKGDWFCRREWLAIGIFNARLNAHGVGCATFESALKGDAVATRIKLKLVDFGRDIKARLGKTLDIHRVCELKRPRHIRAAGLICIPGTPAIRQHERPIG